MRREEEREKRHEEERERREEHEERREELHSFYLRPLESARPTCSRQLCTFHVGQAAWRWLRETRERREEEREKRHEEREEARGGA